MRTKLYWKPQGYNELTIEQSTALEGAIRAEAARRGLRVSRMDPQRASDREMWRVYDPNAEKPGRRGVYWRSLLFVPVNESVQVVESLAPQPPRAKQTPRPNATYHAALPRSSSEIVATISDVFDTSMPWLLDMPGAPVPEILGHPKPALLQPAKERRTKMNPAKNGKRTKKPGCTVKLSLPEYCLEIVGDDEDQAREIQRKLKKGIQQAADICRIKPPVCKANLGLTRDKMPQITGDANVVELLESSSADERAKGRAIIDAGGKRKDTRTIQQQLLDYLEKHGVKTRRKRVQVGRLKATQAEIKAAKAYGMADAHLRGDFPTIDKEILISKDGHILDGHHRWAALLTIDPSRYMNVLEIGLPMAKAQAGKPTVLGEAAAFPGVYKATFAGDPLPAEEQREYKRANKSQLTRATTRRATKVTDADRRRATMQAINRLAGK